MIKKYQFRAQDPISALYEMYVTCCPMNLEFTVFSNVVTYLEFQTN